MTPGSDRWRWPDGKRFAFAIIDDTDKSTLENAPLAYALLTDLGMKASKTVWPVAPTGPARTGGSTCDDPAYLSWVLDLQAEGHEIAFHNASDHSSTREQTIAALDRFEELFGAAPRVGADHSANREALYGGPRRLSGVRATAYAAASRVVWRDAMRFDGHDPRSDHFWGDVCRDRIEYWRGFTYRATDLLATAPTAVYHDPDRPYVRNWFIATDAPHRDPLLEATSPDRLDALESAGGACILATHLGTNFVHDGTLDQGFDTAMRRLAERPGWFTTTSELLDHLRRVGGDHVLTDRERRRLELRWMADAVTSRIRRTSSSLFPRPTDGTVG